MANEKNRADTKMGLFLQIAQRTFVKSLL